MLRILHQTLGPGDAERRQAYIASVRRHHPHPWRHVFWTDNAIAQCVQQNQPELFSLFTSALPIVQSDIGRYCVLEANDGGLYLDSDVWVTQSLERAITNASHHFTRVVLASSPQLLPFGLIGATNYIMYAPWPHHQFRSRVRKDLGTHRPGLVSQTSGCIMLDRVVAALPPTRAVGRFTPPTVTSPFCPIYNWPQPPHDAEVCAVHHGGTARQDGDSWSSNLVLRSVATECALRHAVGTSYDGQLPCIMWVVLVGFVLLAAVALRRYRRRRCRKSTGAWQL